MIYVVIPLMRAVKPFAISSLDAQLVPRAAVHVAPDVTLRLRRKYHTNEYVLLGEFEDSTYVIADVVETELY